MKLTDSPTLLCRSTLFAEVVTLLRNLSLNYGWYRNFLLRRPCLTNEAFVTTSDDDVAVCQINELAHKPQAHNNLKISMSRNWLHFAQSDPKHATSLIKLWTLLAPGTHCSTTTAWVLHKSSLKYRVHGSRGISTQRHRL